MRAVGAFGENRRASLGHELTSLETGNESKLLRREGPEMGHRTERAVFAGDAADRDRQDDAHSLGRLHHDPLPPETRGAIGRLQVESYVFLK